MLYKLYISSNLALLKVFEAYAIVYTCYLLVILALLKVFETYVMFYMCYLLIIQVLLKKWGSRGVMAKVCIAAPEWVVWTPVSVLRSLLD